jgi:aminocarboxymuconate-semialdehyde decarboxylase
VHDDETFRFLIKMFGASRIALGSDFPFPLGDLEHGKFIKDMKELTKEQKEQVLYKTAKEWLGLKI